MEDRFKNLEHRVSKLEVADQREKSSEREDFEPMSVKDQSRLSYLTSFLVRAPGNYKELINSVYRVNPVQSDQINEVLSVLTNSFSKHFDHPTTESNSEKIIEKIATELLAQPCPVWYAGRALEGSLNDLRGEKKSPYSW